MTVQFHDVSHHNDVDGDPYHPTGPTVAKATEGGSFRDPSYAVIRQRTLAGGWPFLAYHYVTTDPITDQVTNLFNIVGRETRVMWDWEKGGGDLNNLLRLHDAFTAKGGYATVAYPPEWYCHQQDVTDLTPLIERGLAVHSSEYVNTYTDTGPGWNAYYGVTPDLWQWTDHPIDGDAFKGTIGELADLWEGTMRITPAQLNAIADAVWNFDPGTSRGIPNLDASADKETNLTVRPLWLANHIGNAVDSLVSKGGE